MLVNFTFRNFRSFKNEKTLSMEASSIKEHRDSLLIIDNNKLLPVAVLYGANSSGKSNVLRALQTMRKILLESVKLNPNDKLAFMPFMLDNVSAKGTTEFEIEFIKNGFKYRYGFEYDRTHICQEWLYEKALQPRSKENCLFLRENNDFSISKKLFKEGVGKENSTTGNRLFVSLVAQLNGPKSVSIMEWFSDCNFLSGLNAWGYEDFTMHMFKEHQEGCDDAIDFLKRMQLGFEGLVVNENEVTEDMLNENFKQSFIDSLKGETVLEAETIHLIYDENGEVIDKRTFDKDAMESEGSKKMIEMAGPLFDTLLNGKILVIDELDAKLHPLLTRSIVQLFMDSESNKNGAQLIFATHDTNLLNKSYLRRDQIWFTEKDKTDSSDLYSLVEFTEGARKVRNDRSFAKDYINGRYGAIPFIH